MDARSGGEGKQAWSEYLARLPASHPLRDTILESWWRSHEAGRDPAQTPVFRRVPDGELQERLRGNALLIAAAKYQLPPFLALLPGHTNVGHIADLDGIVLWSTGDEAQIASFGLEPGVDWSEQAMGTNGAGTALRTLSPVAIIGEEHYLRAFHNCTCTAAPIRSPSGKVIGVLDVSSSVRDANPERLEGVIETARLIGAALRWLR